MAATLKSLLAKVNVRKLAVKLALVAASGAVGALTSYFTKNPELLGPATALVVLLGHELGAFLTRKELSA